MLLKKNHCNFPASQRSIAGKRFKSTKTDEPREPCWGVSFSLLPWKPFQVMLDPSPWFPGSDLRQRAMKIYSTAPLHRTVGCIMKTDLNIGTQSCMRDLVFNDENRLLFSAQCQVYMGITSKETSALCRDRYWDISRVLLRCLQGRLCCRMDTQENFLLTASKNITRSRKRHHYLSTGFPVSKSFPVRFDGFPVPSKAVPHWAASLKRCV